MNRLAKGAGVALAYVIGAATQGIGTPGACLAWLTDYLHSQHGLQVSFFRSGAQSVIGMGRCLIQLHDAELFLANHWPAPRILALYASVGMVMAALVIWALSHPAMRRRLAGAWRDDVLLSMSVCLMAAWSVFAFAWEPAAYYWSVSLIPFLIVAAWLVQQLPKRGRASAAAVLVSFTAWNLWANHRFDQRAAVRAPEPLLRTVEARLGPRDLLVVPARDWLEDVDYDVLLTAWDFSKKIQAIALIDDVILVSDPPASWPRALVARMDAAWAAGGAVYVSDLLFRESTFRELGSFDAYAVYRNEAFEQASGSRLYGDLMRVLGRFPRRPAPLSLNSDHLWEIKKGSRKSFGAPALGGGSAIRLRTPVAS